MLPHAVPESQSSRYCITFVFQAMEDDGDSLEIVSLQGPPPQDDYKPITDVNDPRYRDCLFECFEIKLERQQALQNQKEGIIPKNAEHLGGCCAQDLSKEVQNQELQNQPSEPRLKRLHASSNLMLSSSD